MIEQLIIENAALIERQEIEFGTGLNVLSGETGAGKTMIIDSVNFLLGERSSREFIRAEAETAEVQGLIRLSKNPENIETDEDGALHLYRMINSQGRGVCRINGRTVTLGMLRDVSAHLADVHGQHEHQSLLNSARHITLLDKFCVGIDEYKTRLGEHIRRYKELTREISELAGGADRESRLEILRYQKDEINTAALKSGEEEELSRRRQVLLSTEKLAENAAAVVTALYDGEFAAIDNIAKARAAAAEIARLDESQQSLADSLADAHSLLDEVARDVRKYYDTLEHNPDEIAAVETRLDLLHTLKRKYGNSVDDILRFGDDVTRQIDIIESSGEKVKQLKAERRVCTDDILQTCEDISALRKAAASNLERRIETGLHELGMKDAEFKISIERKKEFSAGGYDRVEFLIAPNPGEGNKPLAKIASGGEMSRVMLALKVILADADHIETFVFDEIDAGVSGRTAQKVAEKLALLAKRHQVLCITHLPQIAAMADSHFLIEKHTDELGERTATSVSRLDEQNAVAELARLLGGAKITDATMKAAKEMRELAEQVKKGHRGD